MASRNRKTQNTESSGKNSRTGSGKQNTQTRAVKKQLEVYEEEPDYDGGTLGTEVSIIVTFAVCALLFLSNFGLCESCVDACGCQRDLQFLHLLSSFLSCLGTWNVPSPIMVKQI